MGEDRQDAGEAQRFAIDYKALESIDPLLGKRHRHTVDVLIWTLLAGRQIEAWLSDALAARQLDTSSYFALSALWLVGPPHRMTTGELAGASCRLRVEPPRRRSAWLARGWYAEWPTPTTAVAASWN